VLFRSSGTLIDAKGDLLVGTANDVTARLPVGTDGYLLTADSAQTAGIKWAAAPVSLPTQTGQSGKLLTTDGTTASWSTTVNGTAIPASKTLVATDSTAYVVPSQTSNSGKYLTTDGTTSSWGTVSQVPTQTGNSGKYLTTNGSTASWAAITTDPLPQIMMMMGA